MSVLRQFVVSFPEERLTLRSAAPQRKEPERASRERDLGTDETMHPVPVDREHVAEQVTVEQMVTALKRAGYVATLPSQR